MKHNSYKNVYGLALPYLNEYFCLITKNNEHLDFDFDVYKEILLMSELKVSSEIQVFNFANAWIQHATKERSKFALELLKTVRLPLLTSEALESLLHDSDNAFVKSVECTRYIQKVIDDKEDTSVQQSSNVCQQRYYNRIYMTAYLRGDKSSDHAYQIYHPEENNHPKPLTNVKTQKSIAKFLFVNETLYLLNSGFIMSYSTITKEWKNLIEFSFSGPGHDCSACVFMSNLYILGGCNGGSKKKCFVFDTASNKYEAIAPLIFGREYAACAVHGGRIVFSGGNGYTGSARKVQAYDHIADEWSEMPDMLESRQFHASLNIRDKLYMLGGSIKQNEVFDCFSNVFVHIKSVTSFYNWETAGTTRHQYIVLGNKVVIINDSSLDAAVFDVEKEEWSEVEDFMMIKSAGCTEHDNSRIFIHQC